jgi:nicotinate-nucleotide adenylyltransferase
MAIGDNARLKAIDIEFRMPKPSYTIDTLTVLQEKYPQHIFRLIIGEDNLEQFMRWKNADKILEYYGLYVYPRPEAKKSDLLNHPNVTVVEAPLLNISATYIRNRIREHKSVKYLVPQPVEAYILQKKFYL